MSNNQVSQLTLEQLFNLDDGLLAAAFDANMANVIRDMNDRPNDDRARKVVVTLTFKPEAHQGDLDRVKLEHKVTATIPSQEGRECTLIPKRLGKELFLVFPTIGTDARQPHLNFEADADQ